MVAEDDIWRLYREVKGDRSEWRARLRTACLALALDLSVDMGSEESDAVSPADYFENLSDFAAEAKRFADMAKGLTGRRSGLAARLERALEEARAVSASLADALGE